MHYNTIVYLVFFALLTACTADSSDKANDEQEQQGLEQENDALKKENEQLNEQEADSIQLQNKEEKASPLPKEEPSPEAPPKPSIRVGQHSFTLQWIGWEKPGTVDIALLENDTYTIKGQQKSDENDDYVSIDGELTVLDEKTLRFSGELVSRVSYLNGGEPCVRQTPVHFKISGSRKYWRLQEKYNCEDGETLDYIDIYF